MVDSNIEKLAGHGITVNSDEHFFYLTFPEGITKKDFDRMKNDVELFFEEKVVRLGPITRSEQLELAGKLAGNDNTFRNLTPKELWDLSWNKSTKFIEDYNGKPAIAVSKSAEMPPLLFNAFVQSYNFIAAEKTAKSEPNKAMGYLLNAMDTGVGETLVGKLGGLMQTNYDKIRNGTIEDSELALIFSQPSGMGMKKPNWNEVQFKNLKSVLASLDKKDGISQEDIDTAVEIAKEKGLFPDNSFTEDLLRVQLRNFINVQPKDNKIEK
jgi:hypothetical protein